MDLGSYLEGEKATGRFDFKNSRSEPLRMSSFRPSCTCSGAVVEMADRRYELRNQPNKGTLYEVRGDGDDAEAKIVEAVVVQPGESGTVVVTTDLKGVNGKKSASLAISTDDIKLPVINLNWSALAAQYFSVVPSEVNLNAMSWNEQREFTVRVSSNIKPDFNIIGHNKLPKAMEISYEKISENGRSWWEIRGTYGPNVPADAPGGIVQFTTDIAGKRFPLRVNAIVQGPMEVKPGTFLQLGLVFQDKGKSDTLEFIANDGFDLDVTGFEIVESSIGEDLIGLTSKKTSTGAEVVFEIKKGAKPGLAFGSVKVNLNHPVVKSKTFTFNGFVRRSNR